MNARTAGRPIDVLLSRLEKVRRVKPGQWIALCPAHDDKHPSLSIAESGDGTVLLHCHSQECPAAAIVAAVGLQLGDLFPQRFDRAPLSNFERRQVADACRWRAALPTLGLELNIVEIAAHDLADGKPLSSDDRARLLEAIDRIHDAREVLQ